MTRRCAENGLKGVDRKPGKAFLSTAKWGSGRVVHVRAREKLINNERVQRFLSPALFVWLLAVCAPLSAAAQTSIGCGQNVAGEIGSPGAVNFYSLQNVVQGDFLFVTMAAPTPPPFGQYYQGRLELYDGAGTLTASSTLFPSPAVGVVSSEIQIILTTPGPYVLAARGADQYTGAYRLSFQQLNNPCNSQSVGCGDVARGTFTQVSDVAAVQLQGVGAGDDITIAHGDDIERLFDVGSGSELFHVLTGVNKVLPASLRYQLTTTGPFVALVYSTSPSTLGAWRRSMQIFNRPCGRNPILCGTAVTTTIAEAGEMDFFQLPAIPQNGHYRLWMIRTNPSRPRIIVSGEVYTHSGSLLARSINQTYPDFGDPYPPAARVDFDGTSAPETIFARAVDENGYPAGYRILLQRLDAGGCGTAPLACGQTTVSSFDSVGEIDAFTVNTATMGDRITLRMPRGASRALEPTFELFDGAGSSYGFGALGDDGASMTITLTTAGPYALIVWDQLQLSAVPYTLFLERTNNPCTPTTLSCFAAVSAALTPAGDIDAYKLAAVSQGDSVTIRMFRANTSSMVEKLELYSANGVSLGSATSTGSGATLSTSLAFAGPYTLIVRDDTNTTSGNYLLTLKRQGLSCFQFSDDPPIVGVTSISAQHIVELRLSVDNVRASCGVFPSSWSESIEPGRIIRAQDIIELRAALNQAYDCRSRTRPVYTDPVLQPGNTIIRAVHVIELRNAVRAIE
jgi:hypothetical protein